MRIMFFLFCKFTKRNCSNQWRLWGFFSYIYIYMKEVVGMRNSQLFGNNAYTQYDTEPPCAGLEKLPPCNGTFFSSQTPVSLKASPVISKAKKTIMRFSETNNFDLFAISYVPVKFWSSAVFFFIVYF